MDFTISEELKMVQTLVRDFVREKLIPEEREILGRDGEPSSGKLSLAPETEAGLVKTVKDMGLWGLNLPEELGGVGLDALGISLIEEELARTVVPFDFGNVTPLLFDLNEEQKDSYLTPVLEKKKRAAIALLEPDKEADPNNISTRAEKTSGGYLLNGHKLSFTTVGEGDFAIVFAVTSPEADVREGVTCFLVDCGTPGFAISSNGSKGWYTQKPIVLSFKECLVPQENVLGAEGKAFHLGGKWLPRRRITRGARCVGAATRLLEASAEYAKTWEKFGQTVSSNLSVRVALADMATEIKAARLMVYNAAWKADAGDNISQETAMVKIFTTQMLQRTADRAVYIHGGPLYAKELPIARLCQDAVITNSLERALDLQRAIIITDLLKRIGL